MVPDRLIEVVLAPKDAWKRLALLGEGLGPWSGYYGKGVIQLGEDSDESNVTETLSHEFMHCLLLLWVSREATEKMHSLWYKYEGKIEQSPKFKELLMGLTHSGIGFPEDTKVSELDIEKNIPWDRIIEYHDIPFFGPDGFYQFKYNKIYIRSLTRDYPLAHKYYLEHEKAHYINNNSKKTFFQKVFGDIAIEWLGWLKILRDSKLRNDIKAYKKKKSEKEINREIKIHYFITKNFRPDSTLVYIIAFLSVFYVGNIIATRIFGYNVINFYFQLIKIKIKSIIC